MALRTKASFLLNWVSSHVQVAVLGSGSFGTAMATVVARNGFDVCCWKGLISPLQNPDYLSSYELPENLRATTDPAEALCGASFVLHCVPLQATQDYLMNVERYFPADCTVVSTSKGLHSQTLEMMCDLLPRVLGAQRPMCFVSGPSFAKELMERLPTGLVVASKGEVIGVDSMHIAAARKARNLFVGERIRVYLTTDVVGVELGGALKNIFAIAAGAVEGMGMGMNTTAMLVTRGCKEMTRLAEAMGARHNTMTDLSGIGDLMLTCFGSLSRNRTVGVRLGRGESISDILASSEEVAEGVATAPAGVQLARKYNVDAPIMSAVAAVLAGEKQAKAALIELMQSPILDADLDADAYEPS